jgi:hypothetical protein
LSWNLGASTSWNPLGLSRPVMGLLYLLHNKLTLTRLDWNSYRSHATTRHSNFVNFNVVTPIIPTWRPHNFCFRYINYLGSIIKKNARRTGEIKPKIGMAKAAFNKKKTLFTSKLDLHFREKLVKCHLDHGCVWCWNLDCLLTQVIEGKLGERSDWKTRKKT